MASIRVQRVIFRWGIDLRVGETVGWYVDVGRRDGAGTFWDRSPISGPHDTRAQARRAGNEHELGRCITHDDCREHRELGVDCYKSRGGRRRTGYPIMDAAIAADLDLRT